MFDRQRRQVGVSGETPRNPGGGEEFPHDAQVPSMEQTSFWQLSSKTSSSGLHQRQTMEKLNGSKIAHSQQEQPPA